MEQMKRWSDTAFFCQSKTCEFIKECAQHESAGDFRSESGDTPNVISINEHFFCNYTLNEHSRGMLLIDNGKLIAYEEKYGY